MHCTRPLIEEIWDRDENAIDRDSSPVGANEECGFSAQRREGGVGWELGKGWVREGSRGGDMCTEGVGVELVAMEGGIRGCKEGEGMCHGGHVVSSKSLSKGFEPGGRERCYYCLRAAGLCRIDHGRKNYCNKKYSHDLFQHCH